MNATSTPDTTTTTTQSALLRAPKAASYCGVSESYFWAAAKSGKLPAGIKLSPRVTVWRVSDLDRAISQLGK